MSGGTESERLRTLVLGDGELALDPAYNGELAGLGSRPMGSEFDQCLTVFDLVGRDERLHPRDLGDCMFEAVPSVVALPGMFRESLAGVVAPSRRDRHQARRTTGAEVTGSGETPTLVVMGRPPKPLPSHRFPGAVWL